MCPDTMLFSTFRSKRTGRMDRSVATVYNAISAKAFFSLLKRIACWELWVASKIFLLLERIAWKVKDVSADWYDHHWNHRDTFQRLIKYLRHRSFQKDYVDEPDHPCTNDYLYHSWNTIIVINFKNEVSKDMGYRLSWLPGIIKGLFWSSILVSIVATISTVFGIHRDLGAQKMKKHQMLLGASFYA